MEARNGIDPVSAADQIEALEGRLDENLISRRPIPSTLPSHKSVYLGILAITILGSAPAAMTLSDANIMNMPAPVDSTDEILISVTGYCSPRVHISCHKTPSQFSVLITSL